MDIEKKVIEFQKQLSKKNIDFLEYVEKNPECLNRSNFKLMELNDKLFTLQPWPTFINCKTKAIFQDTSEKIFNLIKFIPERIFNNDPLKISAFFELPEEVVRIQLDGVTHDHLDNLIGRGDFIYTSSGLKCLEYNVTANLGGWQVPIWESLSLNVPLIAEFLKEYDVSGKNANLISLHMEHCVQSALSKMTKNESQLNIAFVARGFEEGVKKVHQVGSIETYFDILYKEVLHRMDKSLSGSVILCDFSQLRLVDDCIYYKEMRVHVVTEMLHGLVSRGVVQAFKAGNISLINGPVSNLLSNKLCLAVLSDYETYDVFTDEEKEIIDANIPWTRKVTPGSTTYKKEKIEDLEHFLLSGRENFVLKPSNEYGGVGICVGRKVSQEQWETHVKTAFKSKGWLVQEFVESIPGVYQSGDVGYDYHDIVWGFFVFGSHYSGAWARVMPQKSNKGVINCHQGATVSIIFEVDE